MTFHSAFDNTSCLSIPFSQSHLNPLPAQHAKAFPGPSKGEFSLFPLLLTEIRLNIWLFTITPRVLPSPPIHELAVCAEARQCLLKHYERCFLQLPRGVFTDYHISLYACFEIDTLCLDFELADGEVWEVRSWLLTLLQSCHTFYMCINLART